MTSNSPMTYTEECGAPLFVNEELRSSLYELRQFIAIDPGDVRIRETGLNGIQHRLVAGHDGRQKGPGRHSGRSGDPAVRCRPGQFLRA